MGEQPDGCVFRLSQWAGFYKNEGMKKNDSDGYERLLAELSGMYESAVGLGVTARSQALVQVFWEMGSRIVNVLQMADGARTAMYGENVVERLGRDLTRQHGKGFGRSNMFNMRRFALAVPREEISPELSWTHYQLLLRVNDEARRAQLMHQVIEEGTSCEALRQLVGASESGSGVDGEDEYRFGLLPREGQPGIVKVEKNGFAQRGGWLLNLGFEVRKEMAAKEIGNPQDGELRLWNGDGRLTRVTCGRTARYCYDALVKRVVDGDTLVLRICLADGTFLDERIRLRGVDADELPSKSGKRAAAFVRRRVGEGDRVRVHTFGGDRYGRYVGDVFYGVDLRWLSRELVEKKVARFLDMKI